MLQRLRDRLRPPRPPEAELDRARALRQEGRLAEAIAIWTKLAHSGIPRAQTNLGACYATATGLPHDPEAAHLWLRRGAEAGDPLGQRNLATLLLSTDPAAAFHWFHEAATAGDAESQDQLSRMLLDGTGIPADPAEARRWAEAAAGQGVPAAAARLGTLCHDATGGPRDPAAAAHWWHVAAKAGDADSAARLGAALHLGQGLPPDQVAATAWLLLAASRHSPLVRPFLNRVRDGLTQAQLAEAHHQARALGWPG